MDGVVAEEDDEKSPERRVGYSSIYNERVSIRKIWCGSKITHEYTRTLSALPVETSRDANH